MLCSISGVSSPCVVASSIFAPTESSLLMLGGERASTWLAEGQPGTGHLYVTADIKEEAKAVS